MRKLDNTRKLMASSSTAAAAPHALVVPYPAQGHIMPLMELAHRLLDHGFTVTFVNTELNHRRVSASLSDNSDERLRLVAVADGMAEDEDRSNLVRFNAAMEEAIPTQLEPLLDEVTCVVVDVGMPWALDGARRRVLPTAAFWAASAAVLAVLLGTPKLIRDGVIDADGSPKVEKTFKLSSDMLPMDTSFLAWNFIGDRDAQRQVFHYLATTASTAAAKADILLCNSSPELEPSIFAHTSTITPIGPLRTGQHNAGHFWRADDVACLSFLDAQLDGSVIYIAFGSMAVMSPTQLWELALALEASGRPFLWVVRPGAVTAFTTVGALPNGFADRVAGRGKVVAWAPQARVLRHPAVACFVTHCGWNSTVEGVCNGVPMLCWPYFTDQFTNQVYICDVWRVGLRMVLHNGSGVFVTRAQIEERLVEFLGDDGVKERVQKLEEMAHKSMSEEGGSWNNLNAFIESMKR